MVALPEDTGVGTQIELPLTNALVIVSFLAIAWYNVAELTVIMHCFFKRHVGVYFYSLLIANWGIFFHALGMFLKFYKINDDMKNHTIANTVIVCTGWVMMITGQAIVLWSRLHLVCQARWTRWVLIMIVTDALLLHTITIALTFFVNISKNPEPYIGPYSVVERIQVTIFFIQEVILSGTYIWKTMAMLRAEGPLFISNKNVRGNVGRKVLIHTIVVSVFIIILDITLIVLEFCGLYDIQTSYKGAVYSVKLKMEFTILNQLMNLVNGKLRGDLSHTTPHTVSKGHTHNGEGVRSIRPPGGRGLGHSAGAYSRMDDTIIDNDDNIELGKLKYGDVLKTTTTEVCVDQIERVRDKEGPSR